MDNETDPFPFPSQYQPETNPSPSEQQPQIFTSPSEQQPETFPTPTEPLETQTDLIQPEQQIDPIEAEPDLIPSQPEPNSTNSESEYETDQIPSQSQVETFSNLTEQPKTESKSEHYQSNDDDGRVSESEEEEPMVRMARQMAKKTYKPTEDGKLCWKLELFLIQCIITEVLCLTIMYKRDLHSIMKQMTRIESHVFMRLGATHGG